MHNEEASVATVLVGLLFSVIFSASVIAFLLLQFYGASAIVPELPAQGDVRLFASNQNYQNGTFDLATHAKSMNSVWEKTAKGMECTQEGTKSYSYLLIDNLQPDAQGLYQNSYWIDNSATGLYGQHSDWCIGLRITGGVDQNEICAKSDGFHIPKYFIDAGTQWGDNYFYPYPGANEIDYPVVKTIYNDKTPSVDFYLDGVKFFTTENLNTDANLFGLWGRYYAGIGTQQTGVALQEFQTDSPIVDMNTQNGEDLLGMISGFIITVLKLVAWNVDPRYLPNELNLIFIKTQLAGIIACIVMIIRGVG